MAQPQFNSLEKLHANLMESGKISRHLTWIIFICGIFFVYLTISYPQQPYYFKVSFLGQLQIKKTHLILISPIIIATLNLASVLMYIYTASLSGHMRRMLDDTSSITLGYLHYPSFENLLGLMVEENGSNALRQVVLTALYWSYKLFIRGSPFFLQLLLVSKAFRFSPSTFWA